MTRSILRGSAIVIRQSELDAGGTEGFVHAYYEGGAVAEAAFGEKLLIAAHRLNDRAPTVARTSLRIEELKLVGLYDLSRQLLWPDEHGLQHLVEWGVPMAQAVAVTAAGRLAETDGRTGTIGGVPYACRGFTDCHVLLGGDNIHDATVAAAALAARAGRAARLRFEHVQFN